MPEQIGADVYRALGDYNPEPTGHSLVRVSRGRC